MILQNKKYILYKDRSGVFGYWLFDECMADWEFHKEIETVSLSKQDMLYVLEELDKIEGGMGCSDANADL